MRRPDVLAGVRAYYQAKLRAHGRTPAGVDWNSADSQALRFEQLAKLFGSRREFSLTDYGCGYGALLDHLRERGLHVRYQGFDIAEEMVQAAREAHGETEGSRFVSDEGQLVPTDFAVASGVFNVKLSWDEGRWQQYVLEALDTLAGLGQEGFAFNALSRHSDPEKRRADLYYADPSFFFDHCRRYSPRVALLHDYPLFEFTMLVRKPQERT
jgi:SAM-dependent methyltransferase